MELVLDQRCAQRPCEAFLDHTQAMRQRSHTTLTNQRDTLGTLYNTHTSDVREVISMKEAAQPHFVTCNRVATRHARNSSTGRSGPLLFRDGIGTCLK